MGEHTGWIGVDLDRTLAFYDEWRGVDHVGEPIEPMVDAVRRWLADGRDVRIMTARVCSAQTPDDIVKARAAIEAWCLKHLGRVIPITAEKDFRMWVLFDDRAFSVIANIGVPMLMPTATEMGAEELCRVFTVPRASQ